MSFSQQSRSDLAAAEADQRRRQANERPQFHETRDPRDDEAPHGRVRCEAARVGSGSRFAVTDPRPQGRPA